MRLTLGFSPCPNDTFIFDAIVNKKIDTMGFDFDYVIADVEELNKKAINNNIDITKLSIHAFGYCYKNYQILNSGSAIGYKNGPKLISKKLYSIDDLSKLKVAIPGVNTTANMLLDILVPNITNKVEILFSEIEKAILTDFVDAGLIIHETRFTYQQKGLHQIIDLGELWENTTQLPVPLGCIAIKNNLPLSIIKQIDGLIKNSILFGFKNRKSSLQFIKKYAQELSEDIINDHINLYVNDFTVSLENLGKKAILTCYKLASENYKISPMNNSIFID